MRTFAQHHSKSSRGPAPGLKRSQPAQPVQRTLGNQATQRHIHEILRSPGHPLGSATRAFFERCFGVDFQRVRVHADARAAESAQALNA